MIHWTDVDLACVGMERIRKLWLLYSLAAGMAFLPRLSGKDTVVWWIYGILAVYLIVCSVMDTVLEMVCDFFHYIGLLGGWIFLIHSVPAPAQMGSLLLFVGIQWVIFRKMYGPADMVAFVICAMYLTAEGRTLQSYLMHMAVTFLLLGVVQGYKRNISSKGDLKCPVALLPYITVGFFVII